MKKAKRMIALLMLLVIAAAANVVIGKINQADEDVVSEEKGTFVLTEYEKDDVSGLAWTKGEDSVAFMLSDGQWQYTKDQEFPVDQAAAQALSDTAMEIRADRKIENIENMSDYGLSEPAFTLAISFADGTEIAYSLGDQTPFQDGYYLSVSGQDNCVYVVEDDFSGDFSLVLYDYAALETLPEIGEAVMLSVGNTFKAEYLDESKTVDREQKWYSALSGQPLDGEKMESLISIAMDLSLGALQDYNASDDALVEYALTEDTATEICIKDAEGSERSLLVGNMNDDADYYVRIKGSRMVYALSGNDQDVLFADESDMHILTVAPVSFEDVKEASFTIGESVYRIERNETVTQATDGEAEIKTVTVTRNGVQTDGEQEKAVWELISALNATEYAFEAEAGNDILSVTVKTVNDKSLEITVSEYDADSYLLSLSDERMLLVKADEIDRIIRHIKQFA